MIYQLIIKQHKNGKITLQTQSVLLILFLDMGTARLLLLFEVMFAKKI